MTAKLRLTVTFLVAGMTACAPTFGGRLITAAGEPVSATDARVNIVSLSATGAEGTIVASVSSSGSFAGEEKMPDGD